MQTSTKAGLNSTNRQVRQQGTNLSSCRNRQCSLNETMQCNEQCEDLPLTSEQVQYINSLVYVRIRRASCLCFLSGILGIYLLVNKIIPNPYMDEIFHVDQARAYCYGNFTYWNPKLTTPPGLYLATIGLLKPFDQFASYLLGQSNKEVCSIRVLRLINLIFACGNLYLIYLLMRRIHLNMPRKYVSFNILFSAFTAITFPPFFFFNFLFYTDSGSMFFVLLMMQFDLSNYKWLASFFGIISLFFRQSNIIWMFMFATHHCLKIIFSNYEYSEHKHKLTRVLISSFQEILLSCGGYLFAAIFFVVFVIHNGGIVLGDQEAHTAVPHLAQVPYFFGFTAFFGWPYIFTGLSLNTIRNTRTQISYYMSIAFILLSTAVTRFEFVHPYLLADNRHYVFYVWRRILNTGAFIKQFQVVLYTFTVYMFVSLLHRRDILFKFVFLISIALSLSPIHLLEFRYFIPAFIIWRIHILPPTLTPIALELTTNMIINIVTFYIFLFKPFAWPQEPNTLQRFIW